MTNPVLHIYSSISQVNNALAQWMVALIRKTLQNKSLFTLALSGGNTPKALYELLATPHFASQIEWDKIHFFWGDERGIPFTNPSNNAHMVFEALLNKVPVNKNNIHPINTQLGAANAATNYENLLHQYFDDKPNSFDLVLLGLGDNGHTLSLFPNSPVVAPTNKWVDSFWLQEQEMNRITITPTIVNKAANIAFLVTGSNKAEIVYKVLEDEFFINKYPAQLIQLANSHHLHWFLDEEASVLLKNGKK
jgi:6-phosphogluconolactonase